ncbi:hypothetical protein C8R46DRAFT_1342045 [Mycena filopes]|nr:hypothetical protein C8R46DRAFT_1342045 [Mycena filopes]
MRPLPSPPTSASLQVVNSNDDASFVSSDSDSISSYGTPLTTQSFALRLPIGVEFPRSVGGGAPRLLKARRREGRIFTHSPSSSISSIDSMSSFGGVISAEFWMAPQDTATIPVKVVSLTDEPTITPLTTPTSKTSKLKSKPANIIIPRNVPTVVVVSPTSPLKSATVAFPPSPLDAVTASSAIPQTPLSPFYPLSPLSPNRRIQTPNARIRKLAKLTRTLGENVPIELVFPSGTTTTRAPTAVAAPAPAPPVPAAQKPTKRARLHLRAQTPPVALGPRATALLRPAAPPAWPLTPTPDCTFDPATHTQTAVGLHYALGMHSFRPAPAAAVPVHAAAAPQPTSPPPFSSTFEMDDVSWERARLAVMGPRPKRSGPRRVLVLGGVRKAAATIAAAGSLPLDTGRGTWRKKESTWSGEWNVEDMEELQVQLRRLRR